MNRIEKHKKGFVELNMSADELLNISNKDLASLEKQRKLNIAAGCR